MRLAHLPDLPLPRVRRVVPFPQYELDSAYDEVFDEKAQPRPQYRALVEELLATSPEQLRRRQVEADKAFLTQGITFTVYGDEQGTERTFPSICCPASSRRRNGRCSSGGSHSGSRPSTSS